MLAILGNCSSAIDTACTIPVFPGNYTEESLQACKESATKFLEDYRACANITDYRERCDCILNNITSINYAECQISLINLGLEQLDLTKYKCVSGETFIYWQDQPILKTLNFQPSLPARGQTMKV